MESTAKEIIAANRTGLILCGVEEGRPQWLGSRGQISSYERYLDFHDNYGRFPNDNYPYREVEPNVFMK